MMLLPEQVEFVAMTLYSYEMQKKEIPTLDLNSFASFFNQDWHLRWLDLMMEAEEAEAAGSKTQSKMPVLWDREDWAFLTQFPPWMWKKALQWRYNEGLLLATELREEHPEVETNPAAALASVSNYIDKIVLQDDNGRKYIFEPHAGKNVRDEKGRPALYTGFRKLIDKLEKPIKFNKASGPEKHPAFKAGDPGILDIDPNEQNPNVAGHRTNYHYGLGDHDLRSPVRIDPDVIEDITKHDIPAEALREGGGHEAIKKKLMENPPHTWAGFRPLQHQSASDQLAVWWRAQALGLLGDVGHQIEDPLTGEKRVVDYTRPSIISRPPGDRYTKDFWPDTVGRDDGMTWKNDSGYVHQSGEINLKLPYIKEFMQYKVQAPDQIKEDGEVVPGETHLKQGMVHVPVLNPGTILPQHLHEVGSTQRAAFAARKGSTLGKMLDKKKKELEDAMRDQAIWNTTEPSKRGEKVTAALTKVGLKIPKLQGDIAALELKLTHPEEEKAGQVGDIANLLQNWDLLTDAQKQHFIDNQRSLLHYAKGKYDPKYRGTDKWATRNYVIGMTPHKGQPMTTPTYLSEEQTKRVVNDYLDIHSRKLPGGLMEEARIGVERFLRNRLGWEKPKEDPSGKIRPRKDDTMTPEDRNLVLNMMVQFKEEIISTAATLLALNLNHPIRGICDPDLGLDIPCDQDPKMARLARISYAYDFAWSMSQAALSDAAGSRRERWKRVRFGLGATGVTDINRTTTDKSGEKSRAVDIAADEKTPLGSAIQANRGIMENPRLWYKTRQQSVPREQWLTNWFNGVRRQMIERHGQAYMDSLNRLEGYAEKITHVANSLFNDALDNMKDEEEAKKLAAKQLKDTVLGMYPEISKKLSEKELEQLLAKHKYERTGALSTKEKEEEEERQSAQGWKTNAINDLLSHGVATIMKKVKDNAGREEWVEDPKGHLTIEKMAPLARSPAAVAALIGTPTYIGLGDAGVDEYGVRLLQKIAQYNGVNISTEDAIKQFEKLGYRPVERQQLDTGKTAQPEPAAEAPAQPAAAPTIAAPAAPAAQEQSTIHALLSDVTKNYKEIVAHPDAPRNKLAINNAVKGLEQERNELLKQQPADYRTRLNLVNQAWMWLQRFLQTHGEAA